jgi:REP element-mobilizing transposase RayT
VEIEVRKRSRLPHWHAARGTYFVTFNLFDAVPQDELRRLANERAAWLAHLERMRGTPTPAEIHAANARVRRQIERILDSSRGACWLRDDRVATLVSKALTFFDTERYLQIAWCVMPNHVHTVFTLLGENDISDVMASWKRFTSHEANRVLGREGMFWQQDYFDVLARSAVHLNRIVQYVANNPAKAGLRNWPYVRVYADRL